jgi:uncharacterized membrane protein YkgB
MSKIVEKDGLMTTTYHSDSDKVVIERNIDYKPIVEHNKKLYSENKVFRIRHSVADIQPGIVFIILLFNPNNHISSKTKIWIYKFFTTSVITIT